MDCIEGMKQLEDNSVDSIVTDPPYELGFMGKKWDSTGIAYNIEMWKEAFRVLKPGGYLLAFGGTRTYHRMTCAIEDAGFEIRDCIQWIYGSGFPKSLDISKAIDKKFDVEREVIGNTGRNPNRMIKFKEQDGNKRNPTNEDITIPSTPEAQQWEGWGTCLKPANEPIVVARKPLSEKTVADNVLKWGTGGINIDDCRIEHNEPEKLTNRTPRIDENIFSDETCGFKKETNHIASASPLGRFPANVILDDSDVVQDSFPQSSVTGKRSEESASKDKKKGDSQVGWHEWRSGAEYSDSGSTARYFYCAKTSKSERGEGNNHPTVKPLKLIEYLCKLITPPNGIVLDPFMGSGTTAIACKKNNFNFIGFDNESTYCDISNKRIMENA